MGRSQETVGRPQGMLVFPLFWECLQKLDFLDRGKCDYGCRDTYLEQLELLGDLWDDRLTDELQKKVQLALKERIER